MADIADVLDALAGFAFGAVYPNGTGAASVTGNQIDIAEGWPQAADIDTAMKACRSLVTIYDLGITTSAPQVFNDPGVIIAPVHGMTPTVNADNSVTLVGAPNIGEYVTFVMDGKVAYSYAAVNGETDTSMATAIAALVNAGYPGTAAVGPKITVVGFHAMTVRVGAPATMGQTIWRQKQQIVITIWSPDPAQRTQIAAPIDIALKQNLTFSLPDTSRALMTYHGTRATLDGQEKLGEYRRDLLMTVQYDSVAQFPAWEVTSVNVVNTPNNFAGNPTVPVTTVY